MHPASQIHEPEARDGDASDIADTSKLVWRQLSAWAWESACGTFRIERFIVGEHDGIDDFPWPDRYRVLKRTPEWWFEAAPSEGSLDAAQRACEEMT